MEALVTICTVPECNEIVTQVVRSLNSWQNWSVVSKTGAVVLGFVISLGGVVVSSKTLPNFWHFMLTGIVAACVFAYGVLQPYVEYKQFRKAYYTLNIAYLSYLNSNHERSDLNALIEQFNKAYAELEEKWDAPNPSSLKEIRDKDIGSAGKN